MVAIIGWDSFLQLRGQLFLMHSDPGAKEAVAEATREAQRKMRESQKQRSHPGGGGGEGGHPTSPHAGDGTARHGSSLFRG